MNSKKKNIQMLGLGLMLACFLENLGSMVLVNYAPYIFTDIAGIPYNITSMCMFVVAGISFVNAIFAGAQIQKTHTKMGQFRPWVAAGSPLILIGGVLMFIKTTNIILTTILVCVGYFIFQIIVNYIGTAEFSLQMLMGGDDSEVRNTMASRYWAGVNVAYIVGGLALVPMIDFLGRGNEANGYTMTHVILGVLACIGTVILVNISKPYDTPNVGMTSEEEKVNFGEMVKSVIYNRPARVLFIASIFRVLAYSVLMALMVYQAEYVIGDMMALSYFLAGSGILAVLGNLIAPIVSEKIGGRKRTVRISCTIAAVFFAALIFVGHSLWGFVIVTCAGYFFVSLSDTLEPVMYADAGEYYLNKEGKDTRAYVLSMSNLAAKAAMTVTSLVLGAVLGIIHYEAGTAMSVGQATTLNTATALVPAVCYALYVIILQFHGVSDKEIEKCIEENAEKYGEMPE